MMRVPRCFERSCKHFLGVKGREPNQKVVCEAFRDGIPDTISYGFDLHLELVEGDGGIIYEEGDPLGRTPESLPDIDPPEVTEEQ